MAKIELDTLTLGEVDTIEQLAGVGIATLGVETPQGKFLAALYMVAKRRNGEPAFTFNDALAVSITEAQEYLGLDDTTDDLDETDDPELGKGDGSDKPAPAKKRNS